MTVRKIIKFYKIFKNILVTDKDLNSTADNSGISNSLIIEEQDAKLIMEEKQLMEELKNLQDKHRQVRLVYEKVMDNVKLLTKYDSKKEDTINITQSPIVNLNESKVIDSSNFQNQSSVHLLPNQLLEDELSKNYCEFLETTKKTLDSLFLNHSREEFLKMMKEKGFEPVYESRQSKQTAPPKRKQSNASTINLSLIGIDRQLSKDLKPKPISKENEEYEYADEELRKEDEEIKMEKDEIMKQYKAIVLIIFLNNFFRREQDFLKL